MRALDLTNKRSAQGDGTRSTRANIAATTPMSVLRSQTGVNACFLIAPSRVYRGWPTP
jgi:hypothetical protein